MRIRPVPLRRRLLYLAAAAFVPLAVMSGVSLLALQHQQRQQFERAGIELARALATAVDAELQRSIAIVEVLSASPALDQGNMVQLHRTLGEVLWRNPTWLTIVLADPAGRLLADANRPLGMALGATVERESFEQVVVTMKPAIGYLARGMSGIFAVPVRVPVVRDGKLRYVLTAVVKTDDILEIINRQRVPQDWVVSIFDAHEMRVARSRQHLQYLGSGPTPTLKALLDKGGEEGAGVTEVLDGEPVYTAFSRSQESGWTVAIGIPRSYAELAALRSLMVYGGGLLISIALAILAALIVGRSIARPMVELGAAARSLGRRERLELPQTPIGEIRQVAESLAVAADERARGEAEREQLLEREQQARAIAEAANRSKDEFLAMLGHELRNPLGALANAAHLLGAADQETRAHARAVIGRQVQHLARMTDDLLDAARAMTGKIVLQRQPLELADAVARVLSTLRASGRTGQRRIVQALEPAWVDADLTRIEQIVGNLVGNALKFTPDGGTITVSVARQGDEALLRVADTGIGMAPELAARVFEPFVQGERPLDRSQGGLGIGLTLVRRLAELQGGTAAAESEGEGRGSVFSVRLPAIDPPAVARGRSLAPRAVPARDVLVVEDNDDARETLRRMLELAGHHVRVAVDGAAALDAVRCAVPDVALIDIGLPQMDGYEVARRIRADVHDKRPLLVAITGYGLPEDRNRSREAGFDMHLVKPVDSVTLADVLARP